MIKSAFCTKQKTPIFRVLCAIRFLKMVNFNCHYAITVFLKKKTQMCINKAKALRISFSLITVFLNINTTELCLLPLNFGGANTTIEYHDTNI